MNEEYISGENITLTEMPKYKWKCNLFGGSDVGIVWQVDKPPNFFWRFMQYICFGNKWTKINP